MKGPQVGIIFISGWGTYVWFWNELEAWQRWVQVHLIKKCIWHTFGTQIEDQDQHQDEDKDQVQVSNWRSFGRKKRTQRGIQSHIFKKSLIGSIKQGQFKWVSRMVLWREVTSPFCRGLPPLVG